MRRQIGSTDPAKTRKTRTIWIFCLFAALYLVMACCYARVQVVDNGVYLALAENRVRKITLPAKRGSIFDRNGRTLAIDIETVSVFANFRKTNDRLRVANTLAEILAMNRATVARKLSTSHGFTYIVHGKDPQIALTIRKRIEELPGIGTERKLKRVYTVGSLAAQILGFTDVDNKGVEGLEHSLDAILAGRDGAYEAERGTRGRFIPETKRVIQNPEYGRNVYLTIDTTIQHAAEMALDHMAKLYSPESACAIALDPHTGEILAIANHPSYNSNKARLVDYKLWRNRAVADLFEPGSTMKPITIAAALNEGMSTNTVFARCNGREKIRGGIIPCVLHHPFEAGHGAATMKKIISYSCNIGAAHIAMKLGAEKFYQYEKAFGFMNRIRAGFEAAPLGQKRPANKWRLIELANNGFGQGLAVTPLHMAAAYGAIANGGKYVVPKIVRTVRNHDGSVYQSFENPPLRQAVTSEVAKKVTTMMVDCVENGTGKPARIPGQFVAGKTGSAQIPKKDGNGYEEGAFISSFIGFAPAYKPRVVIAVVVVRPKGSHWGATVAAPVFKEIAEKTLWRLKVPADRPKIPAKEVKPVPPKVGQKIALLAMQSKVRTNGDMQYV